MGIFKLLISCPTRPAATRQRRAAHTACHTHGYCADAPCPEFGAVFKGAICPLKSAASMQGVREVEEWMSQTSGIPLEELRPHMFLLRDRDATGHLMR